MASRETAFIEITPEVLLKAYACGIFPMAESADDPALYWIEPDKRGIIPLEAFHVPVAARAHRALDTLHGSRRPRLRRRDRRLRRAEAGPRPHLDQRAASARSIASCTTSRPLPHRRGLRRQRAGRRALRRVSRPRVLRREHVPPRARRLEDRAGASGRAAEGRRLRLLDTQFVTDHLKTFGAIEVPKRRYHRLLEEALIGEADFAALPIDQSLSGANALSTIRVDD